MLRCVVWMAAVAVAAGLVQAGAWMVGVEFSIVSHSGRGVLLALALGGLLTMLAIDRRPLSDYGLTVGDGWLREAMTGVTAGLMLYGGYMLAAVKVGAATATGQADWRTWLWLGPTVLSAYFVAAAQQVIFGGYLLSIFRERHGRATSVVLVAILFALLSRLDDPAGALSWSGVAGLVGHFLIGAVLACLRLRTGNLFLATGGLAGAIVMRRVVRKVWLLETADGDLALWWCPHADPRQAPVMWAILACILAAAAWAVFRYGERRPASDRPTSPSFKKYFPLSSPAILAPLDVWVGVLWRARFKIGWRYWPRLAATLAVSAVNTIVTLPERLIVPWILRGRRVHPPVFVVGTHRSGTTLLHNLLSLDRSFVTPRTWHVMNPQGCLFSGWVVTPLLGMFLPGKRPMDDMPFHLLSPQEEEFALMNMTPHSPYWGVTLPNLSRPCDESIFPHRMAPVESAAWKSTYLRFVRMLTFWSGKRALMKTPYNTGRTATLWECFPGAKFVHIRRHPYAVYRSNMHLVREAHTLMQLADPDPETGYQGRFLDNYLAMEEEFHQVAGTLPPRHVAEVSFEDLERDPARQIERIYGELGLVMDERLRERLHAYVSGLAGYQKNRFQALPIEEKRRVFSKLAPLFARWGYDPELSSDAKAA
jgi:membrane protease YdiL (CAAX protease family)